MKDSVVIHSKKRTGLEAGTQAIAESFDDVHQLQGRAKGTVLARGMRQMLRILHAPSLQHVVLEENLAPLQSDSIINSHDQTCMKPSSLQACQNVTTIAAASYKLSLKVICGSGRVCLYHCGGSVLMDGSSMGVDDKLARWDYFLGDLACPPCHGDGGRQTMAQIASIEEYAAAGDVVISAEMLDVIGKDFATVQVLPTGRAARLLALSPLSACKMDKQMFRFAALEAQVPSHVAARAAALFRMHVVDNVRQRIEAGHYDFINEIRQITILFMGFPSLSHPTPHSTDHLQPVQDIVMKVARVMHEFQGSFVQFRCDEKGFLAICAFGLPGVSHANNAERGVLSAIRMQTLVEMSGQAFACGVTTGDLLCACVGSKVRSEYTMFGDAINLSARLMCKAKSGLGSILTDEGTAEKSNSKASLQPLTPLKLKGKAHATKVG
jgi:hypothetical protein